MYHPIYVEWWVEVGGLHCANLSLAVSRVCVVGKKFEGTTDHTERWYGTEYSYRKIASDTISQWESVGGIKELHLPAVNEFIPTDFEVLPIPEMAPKVPIPIHVC